MLMPGRTGVVLAVGFAGLIAVAAPAAAQVSSAVAVHACNGAVCETVSALPPPRLVVSATATLPAVRCGHFTMTVTRRGQAPSLTNGPTTCSARPTATFSQALAARLPAGTTIAMQFISTPATSGKAVVRV